MIDKQRDIVDKMDDLESIIEDFISDVKNIDLNDEDVDNEYIKEIVKEYESKLDSNIDKVRCSVDDVLIMVDNIKDIAGDIVGR